MAEDTPARTVWDRICSRCGLEMVAPEVPVRVRDGAVEYRYHPACATVVHP
jgi:hypothetical protein